MLWRYLSYAWALPPVAVLGFLVLVFRDPRRRIPAAPLGIVSPVDGRVVEVSLTDKSALGGEMHVVVIDINHFGTYTARCPVEGQVMDFHANGGDRRGPLPASGLWIRTDEGDDVVLQFRGHRLGLVPKAFVGFGERVGQGERCAYLRLTRYAQVEFTIRGRVQVEKGQRVVAGADLLGKLPHP